MAADGCSNPKWQFLYGTADEMDVQVQQETSENEEVIFAAEEAETVQDEAVDTEERQTSYGIR